MKTTIVSLGGSIIVPEEINAKFLKKFRKLILSFIKKGNRVVLVCGGGNTNQEYLTAARRIAKISNRNLDWIGIRATKLNAELLRAVFGDTAYGEVLMNPTRKVKTNKKIIIASGWKPGWSTDFDAVLWAKTFGAKRVINLSNIYYVYDKDPRKYKHAKPIKNISWKAFLQQFGGAWKPRMHKPFDPIASKKAKQQGIMVIISKGTDIRNVKRILENKKFKGTVIA